MKYRDNLKLSDQINVRKRDRVFRATLNSFSLKGLLKLCKVKMLVVTDSGGYFNASYSFGLGHFLSAFDEPLMFTSFEITKAHRRTDTDADIEDFRFNTHDLTQYDVIWLFGVERGGGLALSDPELKDLSKFMEGGGGVFATGDHEDLGVDMCGQIPRVRSMRRWYYPVSPNGEPIAPPQTGSNYNTIVSLNSNDQSDLTPQEIKVKYYYQFHHSFSLWHRHVSRYPHPVLCCPDGVIDVLPDHMHEGHCEVPSDLTHSYTFDGYAVEEYPAVGGTRLKPEVIAHARANNLDTDFGVIAVYDGHKIPTTKGRVLVDATWHHFFNINIGQWGELKALVDDPNNPYTPTSEEAEALKAYNLIQHYFRNIGYWLARKEKQQCYRERGWKILFMHPDIRMTVSDIRWRVDLDKLQYFYFLGKSARNALGDFQSACQTNLLFLDVLPRPWLEKLPELHVLPEFPGKNPPPVPDPFPFLEPDVYLNIALGAGLHKAYTALAENKGAKEIEEINYETILKATRSGGADGLVQLAKEYDGSAEAFKKLLKTK